MNKINKNFLFLTIVAIGSFYAMLAYADATAPYQNPTYTPAFTLPSAVLPTGAQNIVISTYGASTLAAKFSGTCTGLAATISGSMDNGVTYTQLNFYPYPAMGTAAPTIDADGALADAAGVFKVNVAGFNRIKIAISALTGAACTLTASETTGDFNGSVF